MNILALWQRLKSGRIGLKCRSRWTTQTETQTPRQAQPRWEVLAQTGKMRKWPKWKKKMEKKNIISLFQLGIAYTSATFSALGAAIGQRQNLTYIEWEKDVIHDRIEEAAGSKGSKLSNAPGWYLQFLTSTTFAFSEICPICCCCLSQHGQHTADAAGEVPLAKQQLENHISIISWIGRYPIIWCHTNFIHNMYILLLIFIWNLNPFPNRLSCLREWLCQTQKLERLPAGRKLSIFLQNDSMIPSTSFSACQIPCVRSIGYNTGAVDNFKRKRFCV